MNLSDSDGGMTSLAPTPTQPPPKIERQPETPSKNLIYSATIMSEEKKIDTSTKQEMDSTPISDIMSGNDMMEQQDPRMFQQYPQQAQVQMQQMMPQQQAPAAAGAGLPQAKSANPGNLTDEQMQALFAGVCAVIAFSGPVQDKLSTFVPQFVTDSGHRSTAGIAVTGLIAAIVFYFGKRVVLKN